MARHPFGGSGDALQHATRKFGHSDALSFITTTLRHAAGLSVNDTRTTRFQKIEPFDWRPCLLEVAKTRRWSAVQASAAMLVGGVRTRFETRQHSSGPYRPAPTGIERSWGGIRLHQAEFLNQFLAAQPRSEWMTSPRVISNSAQFCLTTCSLPPTARCPARGALGAVTGFTPGLLGWELWCRLGRNKELRQAKLNP